MPAFRYPPFDQVITSQGCVDAALDDPASLTGTNTIATLGSGTLALLTGIVGGIDANGNLTDFDFNANGIIPDLRTIESFIDPTYEAEQTLFTWRGEYDLTDALTVTYLGSYGENELISQEDYTEIEPDLTFNTTAGPFIALNANLPAAVTAQLYPLLFPGGVVSDPQLGASNTFTSTDLSGLESEQTTHELRLQSDFDGWFNFNLGAIKLDYEVNQGPALQESYYVFSNGLTAFHQLTNAAAVAAGGAPVFTVG